MGKPLRSNAVLRLGPALTVACVTGLFMPPTFAQAGEGGLPVLESAGNRFAAIPVQTIYDSIQAGVTPASLQAQYGSSVSQISSTTWVVNGEGTTTLGSQVFVFFDANGAATSKGMSWADWDATAAANIGIGVFETIAGSWSLAQATQALGSGAIITTQNFNGTSFRYVWEYQNGNIRLDISNGAVAAKKIVYKTPPVLSPNFNAYQLTTCLPVGSTLPQVEAVIGAKGTLTLASGWNGTGWEGSLYAWLDQSGNQVTAAFDGRATLAAAIVVPAGVSGSTGTCASPPSPAAIECLFNWAEKAYPKFFIPAGGPTKTQGAYAYRYYASETASLIVSTADSHFYLFLGQAWDLGLAAGWLKTAGC